MMIIPQIVRVYLDTKKKKKEMVLGDNILTTKPLWDNPKNSKINLSILIGQAIHPAKI
jgi:hypothetical protein